MFNPKVEPLCQSVVYANSPLAVIVKSLDDAEDVFWQPMFIQDIP